MNPVEGTNDHCPQCRYHRPKRTMIIVVRTTCPICHYIEQGRRSPVFADLTELIAWLCDAEERGSQGEGETRGQGGTESTCAHAPGTYSPSHLTHGRVSRTAL